jgi:hypothetical protein
VKKRHHGDGYPGSSREEASYERDEVLGPLKTSAGGSTGNLEQDEKHEIKQQATGSEEAVRASLPFTHRPFL